MKTNLNPVWNAYDPIEQHTVRTNLTDNELSRCQTMVKGVTIIPGIDRLRGIKGDGSCEVRRGNDGKWRVCAYVPVHTEEDAPHQGRYVFLDLGGEYREANSWRSVEMLSWKFPCAGSAIKAALKPVKK